MVISRFSLTETPLTSSHSPRFLFNIYIEAIRCGLTQQPVKGPSTFKTTNSARTPDQYINGNNRVRNPDPSITKLRYRQRPKSDSDSGNSGFDDSNWNNEDWTVPKIKNT